MKSPVPIDHVGFEFGSEAILSNSGDNLSTESRIKFNVSFADLRRKKIITEVSLAWTAEYMSLDSENWLFKKIKSDYQSDFPNTLAIFD